jgi:hypothetical protein
MTVLNLKKKRAKKYIIEDIVFIYSKSYTDR